MKRLVDLFLALLGLVMLFPLLIVVAAFIKLDSNGPMFFRQERLGRGFRPFFILKFRTMVPEAPRQGALITVGNDPRVTRIGRWLRKSKIDELPQLLNILRGDMSFVGPRPEVRKYVEMFRTDYEEILQVRPGLTDLASLKYRDEAEVLGQFDNPEAAYIQHVLPDKARLAREYVRKSSIPFDMLLILRTLAKLVS